MKRVSILDSDVRFLIFLGLSFLPVLADPDLGSDALSIRKNVGFVVSPSET